MNHYLQKKSAKPKTDSAPTEMLKTQMGNRNSIKAPLQSKGQMIE